MIFPAAGHELGHSIWFKGEVAERFSRDVRSRAEERLRAEPDLLEELFPREGKDQEDLFGKYVNEMMVSSIVMSCMGQIEELFCDFVAVGVFGRSYLRAFRYLITSGGYGERPGEYPAQADRASSINMFAARIGQELPDFEGGFTNQRLPKTPFESNVIRLADEVRSGLEQRIQDVALEVLRSAGVEPPNGDAVAKTAGFFEMGSPTEQPVGLGDLVEAAWITFESKFPSAGNVAELVESVSDLVLKSAEAQEFMMLVGDVK